ncbi:MAG TPA: lytic transglycosylase domain-containing protein, partial [Polyangiaceae bacterium LLY-WYZ-15_(1-7)]|nr:lytic transglycosylase domain-containing protein [Polyangiaceae bacterium LLY-WYZ-15_(1-7)]
RGRLHERRGRLADAAEAYGALAEADAEADAAALPSSVRADAHYRRAHLLARLGRCAAARPLLEAISAPPRRAAVAEALRAECLLREARTDDAREEALDALRAAIATNGRAVDVFALRWMLAETLLATGDADEARRELVALWVDRPAHPEAPQVEAALGPSFDPTAEQRLSRARTLLRRRIPADAAALLEGNPPRDRALRARWLHTRGMALYRTRHHYAEAAELLAQAARLGGATALEDEFHAARALSRADRDPQAIRAYRRFVRSHPRHPRAADAEFLAAWLEIHIGRARGRRSMDRFLGGPRARLRANRRRSALWQLGLTDFERGRHASAARYFERYASTGSGAMVAGRGHYWTGRAEQGRGRRTAAIAAYRRARAIDPLHWYGLWAERRLAELGESDPIPLDPAASAEPLPPPSLPAEARFFRRLGLQADALDALRRHERAVRAAAPRGRVTETRVAAYRMLDGTERAYRLAALQHTLLGQRPEGAARWAWDAAYPRPEEDAVRAAARESGVPWEHLYATMRQESAYDPDVVSHADAIGLLQVLPSSGARAAARLGLPFERDRLFDPAFNVRIGAAEIAALWERYEGVLPLVIAAYNAGAHRVDEWVGELDGPTDLDLFVERIPFDETRGYVRRVVSHFARYRYLEDPDARPELPAQVGGE